MQQASECAAAPTLQLSEQCELLLCIIPGGDEGWLTHIHQILEVVPLGEADQALLHTHDDISHITLCPMAGLLFHARPSHAPALMLEVCREAD